MRTMISQTLGATMMWAVLASCGGGGQNSAEPGLPGLGGGGGGGGGGGNGSSSTGGAGTEPQGWVNIMEPGQTVNQENHDADGWCMGGEGVYACNDGAPAGSGGTPPPGWGSSSSSGGTSTSGGVGTSSSSGGTSSSSGSGGTGSSGVPACQSEDFSTGARVTPQMLLVVDKSGSMDETPAGQPQTKWNSVVSVMDNVTAQLQSRIDFGLALFPASGGNSCSPGEVVVDIGTNCATQINQALASANPVGGTPTGTSLRETLTYMRTRDATRPRAVVLATDGAPNCTTGYNPDTCVCTSPQACTDSRNCLDASGAIGAVTALAQAGISVFVVGIPGTDAFASVLDQMAVAGGTALPSGNGARYYRTTSAADLRGALDAISTRVSTCRFELQNTPDTNEAFSVSIDGQRVNASQQHVNGFDLTGGKTVEMFGPACDALADGGSHQVHVEYCFRLGG